jgi:hypothetical protein
MGDEEFYETDLGISKQSMEAHIVAHSQPWLAHIAEFYRSEKVRHGMLHVYGIHSGQVHDDAEAGEVHAWALLERGLQSLWN